MAAFVPAGGPDFDGAGLATSGFPGLPPEEGEPFGLFGDSWELTFTTPGEYRYFCLLHASSPDAGGMMTSVIVVEA
jgi:hypothetical protein